MQFVRDGDWYLATRITGPTHNLLGLRFGQPRGSHPAIERSSVAAIRFITDDTPSSSTYRFLAKSIVERMVRQGAWSVKS
jgi:hypothetical protein